MTDTSLDPRLEELLVQEIVSSVVFIHDYIQIVFHDHTSISLYNPVMARRSGAEWSAGTPGFSDALVAFIGSKASSVSSNADEFAVHFGADAIAVSMRAGDYRGPEAVCIHGGDGQSVWVW